MPTTGPRPFAPSIRASAGAGPLDGDRGPGGDAAERDPLDIGFDARDAVRAQAEKIADHEDARAIGRVFGRHAVRFERARGERTKRLLRDHGHRVIPR
jgi:hypothetical protein